MATLFPADTTAAWRKDAAMAILCCCCIERARIDDGVSTDPLHGRVAARFVRARFDWK